MRHPLRTLALVCALILTPACESLRLGRLGAGQIENPLAAARTLDQRAYALLHAYAAVMEEATDIVADPATPLAFTRVLARAEAVATPLAEALELAAAAYVSAQSASAAQRLDQAIQAAEAPIAELQDLVRVRG